MIRGVPHAFPYQGSKRQLAREILSCFPGDAKRLVEPFVGSGAITLGAAHLRLAPHFLAGDAHRPLVDLWNAILNRPEQLAGQYRDLWIEQTGRERTFFDEVRAEFNRRHQPHHFLYLLARAVKAAVRYNARGGFNNSPDNRRRGMHPDEMESNLLRASSLLRGKTELVCADYKHTLSHCTQSDIVYMDPPYQGVCRTHNHRYCHAVEYDDFVSVLGSLNDRGIAYIVSYDGRTGSKMHGRVLPDVLRSSRVELHAGRSTQATLLGMGDRTFESLYLSPSLLERIGGVPKALLPSRKRDLFTVAS